MTRSFIRALLRKPILIAELLITFFVVFVTIGMYILAARSSYLLGLGSSLPNSFFYNIDIAIWILVYLLFLFFAVILLGVGLFLQIKRFGFKNSSLDICCIAVAVLTIVISNIAWGIKPGIRYTIDGFHERVQRYINVEEIRHWAETYDVNDQTKYEEVDKSHWPPTLQRLSPNVVYISGSTTYDYEICARWGGVFGHWGLVVGPEDMPFPGSETHRGGEWRAEFSKGVYIWYEIR